MTGFILTKKYKRRAILKAKRERKMAWKISYSEEMSLKPCSFRNMSRNWFVSLFVYLKLEISVLCSKILKQQHRFILVSVAKVCFTAQTFFKPETCPALRGVKPGEPLKDFQIDHLKCISVFRNSQCLFFSSRFQIRGIILVQKHDLF